MIELPRWVKAHYVMLFVYAAGLAIAAELLDRAGQPTGALFARTFAACVALAFLLMLAVGTERKL